MSTRLDPAHYQPARTPAEVATYAAVPDTVPVGGAGKVGLLELGFAARAGRTELVRHYQKSPLQITRPLHLDPARPDLAVTYLMSTGGGLIQADRQRLDVECGPDTAVLLTTQAATKVHRMEYDYAAHSAYLTVEAGAWLEYLPDPIVLCEDARFHQRTHVVVDPDATVLLGETVTMGRLARGEHNRYAAYASDLEIRRPDGTLLVVDTVRLVPGPTGTGVTGPAVLAGHGLMASLYVVTPKAPPTRIADVLHEALAPTGLTGAASTLPRDCGAWVRVLADDPPALRRGMYRVWDAIRRELIDAPAPDLRKS
ncbi:urease accessory protein UreD [Embleya sp. AB8]|uniref:urease accessory protein UreD n=1 Tax=Embleya sp. AB8 TaxID=3156304 RepID=UPI003C791834